MLKHLAHLYLQAEDISPRVKLYLLLQYFDSITYSVQMASLQFVIVQDSTIFTDLESLTSTFCHSK